MTISIAWVRYLGDKTELVFASDSRLSGGGHVDQCQKIFSLPREDCCISFAGSTLIAYPFILQTINTISDYKKVFDRAVDITDLSGRIVALLNKFIGAHEGTIKEDFAKDLIDTSFLFGGWSWKTSKFCLWRLHFNNGAKKYVASTTGIWRLYHLPRHHPIEIAVIGDYRGDYLRNFAEKIDGKIKNARQDQSLVRLDYEPLNALADMLVDPKFTERRGSRKGAIGGSPQITKIYPFMRTMNYAVEWKKEGKINYTVKGRTISDFEIFSVPTIDPFTGVTKNHNQTPTNNSE